MDEAVWPAEGIFLTRTLLLGEPCGRPRVARLYVIKVIISIAESR